MKKIIVFSPHPDDETLGCGGVIAKNVKEGNRVFVVIITDGRYALTEARIMSFIGPLEMREIRRAEANKALEKLGLQTKDLVFLDFKDRDLKNHKKEVYDAVKKILRDTNPNEIYYPQEMEYHVDHQVANKIIKAVVKNSKLNVKKYRYAIAWKYPFNLMLHTMGERSFYGFMAKLLNS